MITALMLAVTSGPTPKSVIQQLLPTSIPHKEYYNYDTGNCDEYGFDYDDYHYDYSTCDNDHYDDNDNYDEDTSLPSHTDVNSQHDEEDTSESDDEYGSDHDEYHHDGTDNHDEEITPPSHTDHCDDEVAHLTESDDNSDIGSYYDEEATSESNDKTNVSGHYDEEATSESDHGSDHTDNQNEEITLSSHTYVCNKLEYLTSLSQTDNKCYDYENTNAHGIYIHDCENDGTHDCYESMPAPPLYEKVLTSKAYHRYASKKGITNHNLTSCKSVQTSDCSKASSSTQTAPYITPVKHTISTSVQTSTHSISTSVQTPTHSQTSTSTQTPLHPTFFNKGCQATTTDIKHNTSSSATHNI